MAKNLAAVIPKAKAQLELQERPVPTPGDDEVLVRNHAVAVNPVDWKIQDLAMYVEKYPNVLGSDVAGVVEAVGSKAGNFQKGDRVLGFANVIASQRIDEGAFQTYTLLKGHNATHIPSAMSFEDATTFPMAVATTFAGLSDGMKLSLPQDANPRDDLHKGQGLLVYGASSSVGAMSVQIAARLGFTVFAVASGKHEKYVRSLGAAHFFDRTRYSTPNDFGSAVMAASKENNVAIMHGFDVISENETLLRTSTALSQSASLHRGKAKMAITLPWQESGNRPSDVEVTTIGAFNVTSSPERASYVFNQFLEAQLAGSKIKPAPSVRVVPGGLGAAQEAWNMNKAGVSAQKLVIKIE